MTDSERGSRNVIKDWILPGGTLVALVVGLGFFISGPKRNATDIKDLSTAVTQGFKEGQEQTTNLRIAVAELALLQANGEKERLELDEELDRLRDQLQAFIIQQSRANNGGT